MSMGTLKKVLADDHKANRFETKIMGFWRKVCETSMRKGEFYAWKMSRCPGAVQCGAVQCGAVQHDGKYYGQVPWLQA